MELRFVTPSHVSTNFPVRSKQAPKSYLYDRVAGRNAVGLTSCRWWSLISPPLPEWESYTIPGVVRNERRRRSVRPVWHRAARLKPPLRRSAWRRGTDEPLWRARRGVQSPWWWWGEYTNVKIKKKKRKSEDWRKRGERVRRSSGPARREKSNRESRKQHIFCIVVKSSKIWRKKACIFFSVLLVNGSQLVGLIYCYKHFRRDTQLAAIRGRKKGKSWKANLKFMHLCVLQDIHSTEMRHEAFWCLVFSSQTFIAMSSIYSGVNTNLLRSVVLQFSADLSVWFHSFLNNQVDCVEQQYVEIKKHLTTLRCNEVPSGNQIIFPLGLFFFPFSKVKMSSRHVRVEVCSPVRPWQKRGKGRGNISWRTTLWDNVRGRDWGKESGGGLCCRLSTNPTSQALCRLSQQGWEGARC